MTVKLECGHTVGSPVSGVVWCDDCVNYSDVVPKPAKMNKEVKSNRRKLTPEQVLKIKQSYDPRRVTYMHLANLYGVSFESIANIINGKTWKHIESVRVQA